MKLNLTSKWFLGYLAIPLSNICIVLYLKTDVFQYSLVTYSATSALVSLLIITALSNREVKIKTFQRTSILPLILGPSYFAGHEFYYLICIMILVVQQGIFDFWTTQFKLKNFNHFRVLFLILTAVLTTLSNEIALLVIVRQLFIFLCMTQVDCSKKSQRLKVRSSGVYVLGTHLIYFGHLMAVSFIATGDFAKYIFITVQIMHQMLLRILDFSIRATYAVRLQPRVIVLSLLGVIFAILPILILWYPIGYFIIGFSIFLSLLAYLAVIKYGM